MKIRPEEYEKMTKKASPNSKSAVNIPMAFLFGGLICAVGEIIMLLLESRGLESRECALWTSVILIAASALLTGLGLYSKMAKHGGAGTLVPITGFANAIVSSAIEFKSEGFVTGLGVKIFIIAGPVILYGTAASVLYGIVLWLFPMLR